MSDHWSASHARGRPRTAWPSTTPVTPLPPWLANACDGGSRSIPALAGVLGDRAADRVLGGVLERAGEAQHLVEGLAVGRRAPGCTLMWPVVTVPVLSSTIVSTLRVDSRTWGPLMRMPSCAPRPVPTSSAVGVASPSAHGQAMISTATAAVNAAVARVAGDAASRRG